MLSKEQGITVIAVCATYELFVAQKMSLKAGFFVYFDPEALKIFGLTQQIFAYLNKF